MVKNRLALIVTMALLSSACSRTEFAYRHADRALEYYAWRTVDITADQRNDWQPLIERVLHKHREKELPLIMAYLDLAGRKFSATDASVGTDCLLDGAWFLYQRHARLAIDLAVPLLAHLDTDQVAHLADYTSLRQEKALERYLNPDPERRKASRLERFVDRIERWTGRLNARQQQQISDGLEQIPDLSGAWLAYREQQTATLLRALEAGAEATAVRARLESWWLYREPQSTETRRRWHTARQEFMRLMDTLVETLTDRQRVRVEKRISDLRSDLAVFVPPRQRPARLPLTPACAPPPV
ncbi:MAG: DUF6279 family lipoprotein [Thiogranum sp.]